MGPRYSSGARGAAAAAPRLPELEPDRRARRGALDAGLFGLEGDLHLHLERAVAAAPAARERELEERRVLRRAERPRATAQAAAASGYAALAERLDGDVG